MGTRAGVLRLMQGARCRRSLSHDPKIAIGRISALFPKSESEDRQAPQSWHLQIARGRGKARAGRAVLQAALAAASRGPVASGSRECTPDDNSAYCAEALAGPVFALLAGHGASRWPERSSVSPSRCRGGSRSSDGSFGNARAATSSNGVAGFLPGLAPELRLAAKEIAGQPGCTRRRSCFSESSHHVSVREEALDICNSASFGLIVASSWKFGERCPAREPDGG
jgi:hypothetical protein